MLLPAVTITCKSHNNFASKNQNNNTDTKVLSTSNQISDKGKGGQKVDHMGNKARTSKLSVRTTNIAVGNKDATLHTIATSGNPIATGKINSSMKKNDGNSESLKSASESHSATKNASIVNAKQSSSSTAFSNVRPVSSCVNSTAHESNPVKHLKDYAGPKKFAGEADSSIKNYPIQYKEPGSVNSPDYKSRSSNNSTASAMTCANLPLRFVTHHQSSTSTVLHRETHTPSSSSTYTAVSQRNDSNNSAFAVARKALEQQQQQQQNSVPKMAPINFPPLRAPQSIVNVRHPLLTDARAKHGNETSLGGTKSKLNMMSSLQSGGVKDLTDHTGRSQTTTFHGYGTSPLAAGIPNVQNLNNAAVTANMSPYPRPDSFPQPTVASMLFSDTAAAQFPQSPPFNTTQIGQLNQYHQTYDPSSFATTPVNVNPAVIPQFSAESSIPYPQYENPPQFVQPNHYPTADMTNSQYQYQAAAAAAAAAAAGVGQIQDSSMFIQSLQSPIAVTDQYATPNYARAVRTELMPRLRRPPRFNK